jgi:hypothetical protein
MGEEPSLEMQWFGKKDKTMDKTRKHIPTIQYCHQKDLEMNKDQ